MTIYPLDNYDTFCLLADAETIITNYIPTNQREDWDATLEVEKEILLRQSTLLIKQKVKELPSTLEVELQQACAFLANHSINKNMTNENSDSNIKIDEVVGVVKTEYFSKNKDSNSFPDLVEQLLSKYDVQADGAFSFNRG